MKRLILPVLLALLGIAAGVGAGILLIRPPEPLPGSAGPGPCGEVALPQDETALSAPETAEEAPLDPSREYVRLDNQFVVPVMSEGSVGALVVLSLSVEVEAGATDRVYLVEPRLRDLFLQVLFDHANTGGFEGIFTATANMRELRTALLRAVDDALPGLITDVLIVDIVRQDN